MQFSQSLSQSFLQYQGQYYPLNKQQIIIGSDQSCDIRIENNPQVFPRHMGIILQGGQVFLQQMEHGAAIWVNGSPASQQILQDNDEIVLGTRDTKLTLLLNRIPAGNVSQPGSSAWSPPPLGQMPLGTPPLGAASGFGAAQQPSLHGAMSQFQAPVSSKVTDTTRYLCVAGHLDEDFQDDMMRNIIYEERRALGESYGVDMSAVVSWCKAGIRRTNIRDGILTGLLLLIVVGFLLVTTVVTGLLSASTNSSPYGTSTSSFNPFSFVSGSLAGLIGGLLVTAGVAIILIAAFFFEKWVKSRWPKVRPGIITYPLLLIPFNVLGFLLIPLIWLTIFIELIVRYYGESIKRLRKSTFNPQVRPSHLDYNLETKLQESFSTQQRNVIAYSAYKPFAGAGYYKRNWSWSFVVDTSKGAQDTSNLSSTTARKTPQAFTVSSLYSAVEKDVWALGIQNVLEIEGKLYVRGQYLPENPSFFNAAAIRPLTSVDPQLVERYKESPTEDVRYYQCLRFNFWRGEMILTAFLRFVKRGKDLFVEIDYLLLPPLKPDYYWADERELTPLLIKIWELYLRSLDNPVQMWLGAPFRLLRGPFYSIQQRRLTQIARNAPAFDYGAKTSVRQAASDDYHLFFQEIDEKMYLQVIEKQILETILNFLEAHQIDTTEFRQRVQMILNNNTTNFNGTINNSGSLAAGSGAHVQNNPVQTTRP